MVVTSEGKGLFKPSAGKSVWWRRSGSAVRGW